MSLATSLAFNLLKTNQQHQSSQEPSRADHPLACSRLDTTPKGLNHRRSIEHLRLYVEQDGDQKSDCLNIMQPFATGQLDSRKDLEHSYHLLHAVVAQNPKVVSLSTLEQALRVASKYVTVVNEARRTTNVTW